MIRRSLASLVIAALLAGCSAHANLVQLEATPTDLARGGTTFKGVPMRVATQQVVQVWHLDPQSGSYKLVAQGRQTLADQKHLYAIDVASMPFASPQLNISENPDNTPKSIEVASTENTSGAIDAATTAVTGYNTFKSGQLTSCATAKATMLTADQAVATAQASYDGLSATASQALKDAYQAVIAKAQAQAAYARANPAC